MSGDEYFAEPTRQQIESSTDATLLDWLLEDAMVAFCYCCSHNIDVRFKWEKKDNNNNNSNNNNNNNIIIIIMNHSKK